MPVHEHRLRVRYSECDPQGVVFNANYYTYFDIALTELWRGLDGGYRAMVDGGVDMVVAESGATFLAPGRFDDELVIATRLAHLGTTSMRTEQEVRRGETLLVRGFMRHVFVHARAGGKTPIPDDVRAALTPWLDATAAPVSTAAP